MRKRGLHANVTAEKNSILGKLAAASPGSAYLCLLGLAATRVWFQTSLYGAYVHSDNGLFSVLCDVPYGIALLLMAVLANRFTPSRATEHRVQLTGFATMTAAGALLCAAEVLGNPQLMNVAALFSGIVAVFGWATWMPVYCRLNLRTALLYVFSSMAIGSVAGFLVGFAQPAARLIVATLMPLVALLCQRAVERQLDCDQAKTAPVAEPFSRVYDDEPWGTAARILAGVAVFCFALGVTRGYPLGESLALTPAERIMHQLGVVVLSMLVIWWTLLREKRLGASTLWRVLVMLMGCSVLLLTVLPAQFWGVAVALANLTDTFMIAVLWITLQDISSHTSRHPYAIFGAVWSVRILARAAGRGCMIAFGPMLGGNAAIIGIIAFAVCASVAIMFTDDVPKNRLLFQYDDLVAPPAQSKKALDEAVRDDTPEAPGIEHGTVGRSEQPEAASSGDSAFQKRYDLSDREMEVVRLIAQGRSKREVGERLFVSENTVKVHVKHIYTKMGIHNKKELLDAYEQMHAS